MVDNMSYIKYEIMGVSSINLIDDCRYKVDNEIIDSILVSKELGTITLYLKENKISKIIEKRCSDFVEEYLLKLCIHPDIEVANPGFKVSSTYIINEDDNNILTFKESLTLKDSVEIIRIYNKYNFYAEIFGTNKLNSSQEAAIEYKKMMSILKNSNKVTKYLLLYEQLLNLVSKDKKRKEQKNVTDFIRKNQCEFSNPNIEFYKTRRKNANFEEDKYTYYRNEISHAEFDYDFEKYEKLTDDLTKKFINGIIEIINYAINEAYKG